MRRLETAKTVSSYYAAPRLRSVERMGLQRMISCLHSERGNESLRLASLVRAPHAAINFPSALVNLGEQRGQILLHPIHSLKFDLGPLRVPIEHLRHGKVFEFHHESWMRGRTYGLLACYCADFCVAETEDMGPVLAATGGAAD